MMTFPIYGKKVPNHQPEKIPMTNYHLSKVSVSIKALHHHSSVSWHHGTPFFVRLFPLLGSTGMLIVQDGVQTAAEVILPLFQREL